MKRLIVAATLCLVAAGCKPSDPPNNDQSHNGWRQWDLPSLTPPVNGRHTDRLSDILAITPDDVWAVGSINRESYAEALTLHWDGTTWTQVPIHLGFNVDLQNPSGSETDNAWAIESNNPGQVAHWDGVHWDQVAIAPASQVEFTRTGLMGIETISATEAWGVGFVGQAAVIERWDGRSWSVSPSPSLSTTLNGYRLLGVSAITSTDVWAVGEEDTSIHSSCLTEHYDGYRWKQIACPLPENAYSAWLVDVKAISSSNVWAVGAYHARNPGCRAFGLQPYIVHWDGQMWHRSALPPDPGCDIFVLTDLAVRSPTDILALGTDNRAFRWDGSSWTRYKLTISSNMYVADIAYAADGQLWAVGATHQPYGDTGDFDESPFILSKP